VGVCVCIRTHTHTLHVEYSDVSPGVRMRHLEGPKDLDGLNLVIHVFVYVCKVHMCIYAGSWDEILDYLFSLTYFWFRKRKAKDVNVTTISKFQSLTSVRIIDRTLRVPNKTTVSFLNE